MKTLPMNLRRLLPCLPFGCLCLSLLSMNSASGAPPALHVSGTRLEDDGGRVVRLQGVNLPSLEWTDGGNNLLKSVRAAADAWYAGLIRTEAIALEYA